MRNVREEYAEVLTGLAELRQLRARAVANRMMLANYIVEIDRQIAELEKRQEAAEIFLSGEMH